ncbi:MAG TPA: aminoglycoside phosphotransferase family protein, partial [Ktedonosporobacter sp.]|nr:aminoglycoside phosphotransferase family protein [Ktedonosporobacter sp.]
MTILHADDLCARLGLGMPLTEPRVVTGRHLHRIWFLPTTTGTFAVKQLNPAILSKPDIRDTYRQTEQIAEAMAAQGIPAVAALRANLDPLVETEDGTVMVYPWIDGKLLLPGPVEPVLARQIGALLARMHALHLPIAGLVPPESVFVDDDWDLLTFHAADRGIPWAYQVRALMPRLLEWSQEATQAARTLQHTLVVSHRHLEQKNVIWLDTDTFKIIDWEASGLINPTLDLVGTALNWSGQMTGAPREESFAGVFDGYVEAGGRVQDRSIDALHALIGIRLGWLLFNMRRSLGESTASE